MQSPADHEKVIRFVQHFGDALRKFHDYVPHLSVDPRGTHVVSMLEIAVAYARRSADLFDSSQELWKAGRSVSSLLLARAFLETVAMGAHFLSGLRTAVERGDRKGADDLFERHYRGSRHPQFGANGPSVSVLSAIDKLAKLQEEFLRPHLKADDLMHRERASFVDELRKRGSSAVKDCYEKLSEFSHPNAAGSHGIYPLDHLHGEEIDPSVPLPGHELRSQLLSVADASRLQALGSGMLLIMELQKLEELVTAYHTLVKHEPATD